MSELDSGKNRLLIAAEKGWNDFSIVTAPYLSKAIGSPIATSMAETSDQVAMEMLQTGDLVTAKALALQALQNENLAHIVENGPFSFAHFMTSLATVAVLAAQCVEQHSFTHSRGESKRTMWTENFGFYALRSIVVVTGVQIAASYLNTLIKLQESAAVTPVDGVIMGLATISLLKSVIAVAKLALDHHKSNQHSSEPSLVEASLPTTSVRKSKPEDELTHLLEDLNISREMFEWLIDHGGHRFTSIVLGLQIPWNNPNRQDVRSALQVSHLIEDLSKLPIPAPPPVLPPRAHEPDIPPAPTAPHIKNLPITISAALSNAKSQAKKDKIMQNYIASLSKRHRTGTD